MECKRRKTSNRERADAASILPREVWTMILRVYLTDDNVWAFTYEDDALHRRRGYKRRRDRMRRVCKLFASILEDNVYTSEYFSCMRDTDRRWTGLDLRGEFPGRPSDEDKRHFFRLLASPTIVESITTLYSIWPDALVQLRREGLWPGRLARVSLHIHTQDENRQLVDALRLLESMHLREITIDFMATRRTPLDSVITDAINALSACCVVRLRYFVNAVEPPCCIELRAKAMADADATLVSGSAWPRFVGDPSTDASIMSLARKWRVVCEERWIKTRPSYEAWVANCLAYGWLTNDPLANQVLRQLPRQQRQLQSAFMSYDIDGSRLHEYIPLDVERIELRFLGNCGIVRRTDLQRYTNLRHVRVYFVRERTAFTTLTSNQYTQCAFLLPPSVMRVDYVVFDDRPLPDIEYIDQRPHVAKHVLYVERKARNQCNVRTIAKHYQKTPFSRDCKHYTRELFFSSVEVF